MSRPIWLQRTPHAHSTTPFTLDKEVILKKLPAIVKTPSYQTQARFQEETFDRRHKERISTKEWQRPYSHEEFDRTKYCPSSERQYHSARINSNIYPEPHSMPTRKADGVDRAFPLKPVYHKRSLNVNVGTACSKDELQRLPIPYVPSPPQGRPEYHGRVGKTVNRKPLEDTTPFKGYTNGRDIAGSQQYKEEKLPEEQRRLAKEIHRKELILQEKLWKTGEQLRRRFQRERAASGDDTRTEERRVRRPAEMEKEWTETDEQQRRRIQRERVASGDDCRREERHVRRPAEMKKEWTENRVPAEQRRRDFGAQERGRMERSVKRETAREDCERQEEEREERGRDRRVKKTHEEEYWDSRGRGERETVKQPERSTERRASERRAERERDRDAGWERLEREKLKERHWMDMRKERDEREEREQNLLRNRWEREKGSAEAQSRRTAEEDIDWDRETKWERSRERYVSSEEKRREQNLARRREEDAQHRPACRLVTGGNSTSSKGMPREAHASASNPPRANRPPQVELGPRESADDDAGPQLVPCRICHRNFVADRLEKHHKVCEKMQNSNRKVFDSARYRAKGTELEEFMKTNSRSKTPELKKNNWRQKHEAFIRNMRQGRVPDGASKPAPPLQDDPDYVTCPHCARRFAPGPAERHIPKCQNIRSRPPPPRPRR